MKKNRMMRLASILLVCVLLSTSVISGTFAKYVSEATVTDTARVAKWDIKLEGAAMGNSFTFNLFDCADSNVELKDGKNVGADGKKLIAPGTTGSFEINLANDSEVNAEYAITYTATETDAIPIEYSLSNAADATWKSDISELNCSDVALNMEATATVTVYWRWVFEVGTGETLKTNDAADTALGVDGNDTVTVNAVVTVTQVD